MNEQANNPKLSMATILPTLIFAALSLIPLVLYEKESAAALDGFFNWFKTTFGSMYLLLGLASLGICLTLAFSKYGKIKFGEPDEKPQFSTPTWVAMLFCTGVAGGVLYWSIAEPLYYLAYPPFYAAPLSTEAFTWAGCYTFFHWGPLPWSFYIICSLPLGYVFFVRKKNLLRVSASCDDLFGDRVRRPVGVTLDILFAIGLLASNISIAGFTVPMVAEAFSTATGLQADYSMQLGVLAVIAAIYFTSTFMGLEKGIARLSNFNVGVAIAMLCFVIVIGPTSFLLDNFVNGVGNFMQNFFRMSTWTDPYTAGTFPQDWTMFYWAYWITYAPLTGLFVARISRGRTIKQIVIHGLCFGMLGAWVIHGVFGGYTLFTQLTAAAGSSPIDVMKTAGIFPAIASVLTTLPMKILMLLSFCVFSVIFFATSLDSSAYAIALACTDNLDEKATPSCAHRMFWAVILAVIPAGLLKVGGLSALKGCVNVAAIPMTIISILMVVALFKVIGQDKKSGRLKLD